MPGMVKRQCDGCRYFFAAPAVGNGVATMRLSRSTSVRGFAPNMQTYVRQRAAAHGCNPAECRALAPPITTAMRPTGCQSVALTARGTSARRCAGRRGPQARGSLRHVLAAVVLGDPPR